MAEAPPRPFTYGETQAGIVAVIEQMFAPALVGLDTDRARGRQRAVGAHRRQPGRQIRCRHGDLGCAGTHARTSRRRACSADTPTACGSATCSGFADPAAMVAEAEKMRDTYGITVFKVKVGRRPVTLDTAVVRALRDRFGDSVELYVDAQPRLDRGGVTAGHAGDGRPRPALRRGAVPRRRRVGPPVARGAARRAVHRRRVGSDARRRDAGGVEQVRHRDQHQDRAYRIHHIPARPPSRRGPGPGSGDGQPDRRSDRHRLRRRLRCRLRTHVAPRRRTVQLPRHVRRPAHRAAAHPRRRCCGCRPGVGLGIDIDPDKLARYRTDRH